ncbi:MAG: hypothetical protein DBX44_01905 [Oscillospiraceae bacterium]|nr:MAG: hypothetical protein DBX44_01905 [Oscillospiraceae bacterium]
MAQNNTAYDFDRLEQHYAAVGAPRVKQPPELLVVENRAHREQAAFRRGVATFILILGVVCAILYNQVQLTELTSEIEQTRSLLEALENDYRLMQVKIESGTSLHTVQQIAEEELGMAKAESYQVQYINLGEGDRVVLARAFEPKLSDRIFRAWYSLMEYLGL